eukprot:GHVO01018395.1.p1 GENE.GHVO01018395.1~~GHVO01018395.1.p1  ORF type:complete len:514 (-),score=85.73 GHVO01018395.1:201-1742(-)
MADWREVCNHLLLNRESHSPIAILDVWDKLVRRMIPYMTEIIAVKVDTIVTTLATAIEVYQQNMKKYVSLPNSKSPSPVSVNLSGAMYRLKFEDDCVECSKDHFKKLEELYKMTKGRRKMESKSGPTFEEAVYVMIKRYNTVIYMNEDYGGSNMHAATSELVFHHMTDVYGVNFECFASPLNSFYSRYFSAFIDTDWRFGSCGSFFDCGVLPEGAYEVGPPYTEEVILKTIDHIEMLTAAADSRSMAVTFLIFVPKWELCAGLDKMTKSAWHVATVIGDGYQHEYVRGNQFEKTRATRHYTPAHSTMCIIIQSRKAQQTTPPFGQGDRRAMLDAMRGVCRYSSRGPPPPPVRPDTPLPYTEFGATANMFRMVEEDIIKGCEPMKRKKKEPPRNNNETKEPPRNNNETPKPATNNNDPDDFGWTPCLGKQAKRALKHQKQEEPSGGVTRPPRSIALIEDSSTSQSSKLTDVVKADIPKDEAIPPRNNHTQPRHEKRKKYSLDALKGEMKIDKAG